MAKKYDLVDYLGDNRNITIPDSVTKIGEGAFHYCESLESVVIPDSVTEIGEGAFFGCPCENKVNKILSDKNKEKDNLRKQPKRTFMSRKNAKRNWNKE